VRERLEPDCVGDFADAQVGVEQEVFRLLDARARDELGKAQARGLAELLAKVKQACVHGVRNLAQRKLLRVMIGDELFRLGDDRRLGIRPLHHKLVALHRKMVGEDDQQARGGIQFSLGDRRRFEISPPGLLVADVHAKFPGLDDGTPERRRRRPLTHHLSGLQKADGSRAELHRHGGFAQAVGAGSGGRLIHGVLREFLLQLEAGGAGATPGRQRAENVFLPFAVKWQLPALNWPQRQRHPRRLRVGALVGLKCLGTGQRVNQSFVCFHGCVSQFKNLWRPFNLIRQDDFQGAFPPGIAERVVGFKNFIQCKVMRDELLRPEPAGHDGLEQQRRGHRVNEPRRDGDVMRPEFFEAQSHARAMHADVGDVAAGTDDFLAEAERGRNADRFDGDIHAFAAGHGHDFFDGFAIGAVDHRGRAKFFGDFKTVVIQINDDEIRRSKKLRRQQRRQSDGPGSDDGHRVTGFDAAIEHAAFVAGRQNVAQHHHRVLVRIFGNKIKACVGKGNADELRLRAVNRVAQNPAALLAMRRHPAPAILALPARRDARNQNAVALVKTADAGSGFINHSDSFMAENPASRDCRQIAFENMQVGAADGCLGHPHHGVGRLAQRRLRHFFQLFFSRTAIHEGFHEIVFSFTKRVRALAGS